MLWDANKFKSDTIVVTTHINDDEKNVYVRSYKIKMLCTLSIEGLNTSTLYIGSFSYRLT